MGLSTKVTRRLTQLAAEIAIRLPRFRPAEVRPSLGGSPKVLVSLTSYPARIGSTWITVESILRQSHPADEVLLVLSREEFTEDVIPERLRRMTRRGLRILWTAENTGSYKKLLPTLHEHRDAVIVTADDDTIYPTHWLASLLSCSQEHPGEIVGHRGTEIIVADGHLLPYWRWPQASTGTPGNRVFLTGMGGILYPPGSLPALALDRSLALQLCPTADDVWFKTMALLAGTPVRTVPGGDGDFPTSAAATQSTALRRVNVAKGGNDEQFARALEYFGLWSALEEGG